MRQQRRLIQSGFLEHRNRRCYADAKEATFGRDHKDKAQVWIRTGGHPGSPVLGWKLPGVEGSSEVRRGGLPDGPAVDSWGRCGGELLLWDILPENCTVSLTTDERDQLRVLLETEYGTINRAASQLGIPRIKDYFRNRLQPTLLELRRITRALGAEETWRRQAHVYDKSPIRATRVTPELAYICGFIFGDGNVRISSRRAAITLTQSPRHEAYTARFAKYWQLHFEALKLRKTRRTRATIRGKAVVSERVDWSVSRRILGHIYSFLTQDHLANLPSLPDESAEGIPCRSDRLRRIQRLKAQREERNHLRDMERRLRSLQGHGRRTLTFCSPCADSE